MLSFSCTPTACQALCWVPQAHTLTKPSQSRSPCTLPSSKIYLSSQVTGIISILKTKNKSRESLSLFGAKSPTTTDGFGEADPLLSRGSQWNPHLNGRHTGPLSHPPKHPSSPPSIHTQSYPTTDRFSLRENCPNWQCLEIVFIVTSNKARLTSRGEGCYQASYDVQVSPPPQTIIGPPNVSMAKKGSSHEQR